ncbi:lipocalin family protein [Polluticoccus soli]|uniref:lipocalin family protein n=1 Tax=Polluticoccus soli TaxID=3034150 RepID=UPI0023E14AA6|nr:lipocalin family protein [Flavipsychrobacter sp. JY13-12]
MTRFLIYPALAICLLAACKKSDNKKLTGNWLLTQYAEDSNSNKVMDDSEIRNVPASPMMNTVYTFKSGDKIDILWGDVMESGTWDLKDDDKKLEITLPSSRVLSYKVVVLDDKKLTLEQEVANNMLYWQTFTKQ